MARRTEYRFPKDERPRRAAFFAQAADLSPYVSVVVGDLVFFVRTDDVRIGRRLFVAGGRNDAAILAKALRRLRKHGVRLPPDPLFVDVGANLGTTTIHALRRQGFARGVALEPSPETFRTLRLNLAANDLLAQVDALQVAAGVAATRATLDTTRDPGRHRLGDSNDGPLVDVVTIDSLVASGVIELARVGLLWLDVQGHEAEVLAGASSLVEKGVPTVVTVRAGRRTDEWLEGTPALVDRLAGAYTDVIRLRKRKDETRETIPAARLRELITTFDDTQDLLLFRR
jgi:FkbM family methyltransferase